MIDLFIFIYGFSKFPNIASSFIPLARAECDDSLPFSGASSIPLCYVLFPATLPLQLFFHPLSLHLAIYFLVCLSVLFPNSYLMLFWEFCFLPFSVHAQTNVIYLTLNLPTTTIVTQPFNVIKWQLKFNPVA